MKNKANRKFFSPFDLLIILFVIMISVITMLVVFRNVSDKVAVVRYKGEVIDTIELTSLESQITKNYGEDDKLVATFDKEGAQIVDSPCSDKICINTGKIVSSGQSIVCLPQSISISIESSNDELDGELR